MSVAAEPAAEFSVAEARAIVKELFEPKPWIYWTDFLLSMGVGYVGVGLYFRGAATWAVVLGYLLASLAFYRAVMFTHELVHLKSPAFVPFRVAWNLLCGIPFMIPSFTYYTHVEHHARKTYGTRADGEYLPLAIRPLWETLWYMAQPLLIPPLAIFRFLVLAPLSWLLPPLRRWLHEHASSMVMDPAYVRPLPSHVELRVWRVQEAACFLYTLAFAVAFVGGWLDWRLLIKVYLLAVGILGLNQLRTLGAHRFRHEGRELTFLEQLLDSINYPNHPLTAGLWAPVGLRYHALHHLFPSMPYHALDAAHWRLMAHLPADSPYRQTVAPSLYAALKQLVLSSWRHGKQRNEQRNDG